MIYENIDKLIARCYCCYIILIYYILGVTHYVHTTKGKPEEIRTLRFYI